MIGYIFWTTSSLDEAKSISNKLLNKKIVACVNILPKIQSLYIWDGKIQEDEEVKVIFKTKEQHYSEIEKIILDHGSYETPEITFIQADRLHTPYQKWLETSIL